MYVSERASQKASCVGPSYLDYYPWLSESTFLFRVWVTLEFADLYNILDTNLSKTLPLLVSFGKEGLRVTLHSTGFFTSFFLTPPGSELCMHFVVVFVLKLP